MTVLGPNGQVRDAGPAPVKRATRPWREYVMTHENLRQYLQMLTNDPTVVVTHGLGSSHSETSVAAVPIGTVEAATTARHESLHMVDMTSQDAMRKCRTPAERLILNALRDGAMERQCAVEQPGTRIQWQYDIDDLMPSYIRADWLTQATIGLYFLVGGYKFPEHKFKPEARDVLARFRPFITPVRKAQDAMETVQYVAPVLALFNMPKPDPVDASDTPDYDGDEDALADDDNATDAAFDAAEAAGADSITDAFGNPQSSADNSIEAHPEYGPGTSASEANEDGEGEGESEDGEPILRDAITYDAGEVADAAEANRRLSDKRDETPARKGGREVRSRSKDKVTGGPSVNALEAQAFNIEKKVKRLEKRRAEVAKERTETAKANAAIGSMAGGAGISKPIGKGTAANLPKAAKPIAEVGSGDRSDPYNSPTWVDTNSLMSVFDSTHGGIGYDPGGYARNVRINDERYSTQNIVGEHQTRGYSMWGATGNYLSRQLRVLMQTSAASRTRSHERHGVFDTRRAYALGTGRFDVFRQPPAGEDNRAAVVMTVDHSGSMSGRSQHAYSAACVVAQALHRLRIPFEVQGFGGYSLSMYKTFNDPMDRHSAHSLSNINHVGGGTPAGEAIAFAWARALTRPEPRRIVFVLTDGDVPENTAKMVRHIEKRGGIVIGVGINTSDMSDVFTHFVGIKDASTLPTEFAKLLRNFVPSGAAR